MHSTTPCILLKTVIYNNELIIKIQFIQIGKKNQLPRIVVFEPQSFTPLQFQANWQTIS